MYLSHDVRTFNQAPYRRNRQFLRLFLGVEQLDNSRPARAQQQWKGQGSCFGSHRLPREVGTLHSLP